MRRLFITGIAALGITGGAEAAVIRYTVDSGNMPVTSFVSSTGAENPFEDTTFRYVISVTVDTGCLFDERFSGNTAGCFSDAVSPQGAVAGVNGHYIWNAEGKFIDSRWTAAVIFSDDPVSRGVIGNEGYADSLLISSAGDYYVRWSTWDATVTREFLPSVPLPAGAPMLIAGIGAFGLIRRRRTCP